jgi:hypothetical protein
MEDYTKIVVCLAIGAATAPIWGACLWVLWQGWGRPHLIPRAEIERLAAELIARHGDRAEEIAFIEEDRAWRYSDGFNQGKWRRVRRWIEGRGR